MTMRVISHGGHQGTVDRDQVFMIRATVVVSKVVQHENPLRTNRHRSMAEISP